jgi:acyl carrier protein phosphodiesterase
MSEGAAFGTDQSAPIYSPYSQYSPVSDKSLANKVDKAVFYKEIVLNSEKRLPNYPAYIAGKKWLEVKTENTRYLYSLRNAMNGLATTPAAKTAAKKVYVDLEELTYGATTKSQEKCEKAYTALLTDFAAYKKTVGL